MGGWKNPFMATADYKNHFYQFPIPSVVRPFFAILCKGVNFVMKVLAMGYKDSPLIAQGASCAFLYHARKAWAGIAGASGKQPRIPDECFEAIIVVNDKKG